LDGAGRLIGFGAGGGCLKLLIGLDGCGLVDPDFGIFISFRGLSASAAGRQLVLG
jgi:hypothetical protein